MASFSLKLRDGEKVKILPQALGSTQILDTGR